MYVYKKKIWHDIPADFDKYHKIKDVPSAMYKYDRFSAKDLALRASILKKMAKMVFI